MSPQRTGKIATASPAERAPDSPQPRPSLHLFCNGSPVEKFSLDLPRYLIGRSQDNDLCIASRFVSRHHILLLPLGGRTILADLDSTNGTFVNSERVFRHVLANDDEITVDRHSMFVQYSIRYIDCFAIRRAAWDDIESADAAIESALADLRGPVMKGDTDVIPVLSENLPTLAACIDDR